LLRERAVSSRNFRLVRRQGTLPMLRLACPLPFSASRLCASRPSSGLNRDLG
jgi:hypothetical protein